MKKQIGHVYANLRNDLTNLSNEKFTPLLIKPNWVQLCSTFYSFLRIYSSVKSIDSQKTKLLKTKTAEFSKVLNFSPMLPKLFCTYPHREEDQGIPGVDKYG